MNYDNEHLGSICLGEALYLGLYIIYLTESFQSLSGGGPITIPIL